MNYEDKTMIEEAERLDKAASLGPWFATGAVYGPEEEKGLCVQSRYHEGDGDCEYHDNTRFTVSRSPNAEGWTSDGGCSGYGVCLHDAEFMAGARTLLPQLAARLRAVLEELNDAKNERDAAFRMLANPNLDNTVR